MFAKNRYISLNFGVPDVQAWFYDKLYVFFENLGNFGFRTSYVKKNQFYFIRGGVGYNITFRKIRDGSFEELLILRILILSFAFCLKSQFLMIFQAFINFAPKNGMKLGHSYRYNSKGFRENFPKFV